MPRKLFWHRLGFKCVHCQEEVSIVEILAAADGDYCLTGVCPSCRDDEGKPLAYRYKTDVGRVLSYCRMADDVENTAQPNTPIRPSLALPAPVFDEAKFLHDTGVSLDG